MNDDKRWILDWLAFIASLFIASTLTTGFFTDNLNTIEANTRYRMACVEAEAHGLKLKTCDVQL